ncbi:peroxidasin-like [Haliotis rubra]|uniref:peroxidasin-like n=1 Tax=Haliotis rubra TaxID=36100 RepID=UPI001EE5E3C2|nr:peroxidasin-like [Haliotis rubra]
MGHRMGHLLVRVALFICAIGVTRTQNADGLDQKHNPDNISSASQSDANLDNMFTSLESPIFAFEKELDDAIRRLGLDDQTFFETGVDFFGGSSAIALHSMVINTKAEAVRLGITERQRIYAIKAVSNSPTFVNSSRSDVLSELRDFFSESDSDFRDFFQDVGKCPTDEVVTCDPKSRFRESDGSCNNFKHPRWGKSFTPFRRFMPPQYDDGVSKPRARGRDGSPLPNPRLVSHTLHASDENVPDSPSMSHIVMQWGQFVDHDITSTPIHTGLNGSIVRCCIDDLPPGTSADIVKKIADRDVCFPIPIPPNDPKFRNRTCLNFVRSIQVVNADCQFEPVEQLNQITAFIDGSQVYGSTRKEQDQLRLHHKGLFKVHDLQLLPESKMKNCIPDKPQHFCFLAGDERVNEQMGLTSLHTIWMREHNRICRILNRLNPHWGDERIFQEARKIIGAMIQKITYDEFLPVLLNKPTTKYFNLDSSQWGYHNVYKDNTDPSIRSAFATAAYRLGHTLIRGTFSELASPFSISGQATLKSLFGNTSFILDTRGQSIPWLIGGMTRDHSRTFDRFITPDVTDNLFLDKDGNSLDLASLNIQRGRDHGLPGYNAWRRWCKLPEADHFGTGSGGLIDHPPDSAQILGTLYSHPDDIDLFPGAISERPLPGGVVGPTVACIIGTQFQLLKEGDRFWYETGLEPVRFSIGQLHSLRSASLARVICDNAYMPLIQPSAFRVPDFIHNPLVRCTDLPELDLTYWREVRPLWTMWSMWSPCINGMQHRQRKCIFGYSKCMGPDMEQRSCTMFPHMSFGTWMLWSSWSPCTNNLRQRRRVCVRSFIPVHTCIGDTAEMMGCGQHHKLCPFSEYNVAQQACLRQFSVRKNFG